MTSLEETIAKILEARFLGIGTSEIARSLGLLDASEVSSYENNAASSIKEAIGEGARNISEISARVGLTPITITGVAYLYGIKLPKWRLPKPYTSRSEIKEQRIADIRQAIDNGAPSVEVISEQTGLHKLAVKYYARQGGVRLPESTYQQSDVRRPKSERIALIRQDVEEGVPTIELMAQIEGLSPITIRQYATKAGINLPGVNKRAPRVETIEAIRQVVAEGATMDVIVQRIGLKESTIRTYAWENDISLPRKPMPKRLGSGYTKAQRIQMIEAAVASGADSVEAVARQVQLSPHTIRVYSAEAGIILPESIGERGTTLKSRSMVGHISTRINAIESQAKREQILELVYILEAKINQLLQRESWPVQKAFEYLRSLKRFHPQSYERFDRLVEIFRKYEEAEKSGTLILPDKLGNGLGLSSQGVASILYRVGLGYFLKSERHNYPVSKKGRMGKRLEILHRAIAEGVKSLEELCRRTSLKPNGFYMFYKRHHIELPPNLIPFRYKPEMDAAIDRGEPLPAIGAAGGYTGNARRQNAYLYLMHSGQFEDWKQKRKEAKEAKKAEEAQICQELPSVLEARVAQLAENASWAERMALRYVQAVKYVKQPYKRLIRLFSQYEAARNKGRKLSLEKLGKPLGMNQSYVGHILNKVGLEPMIRGHIKAPRYSQETKALVRKVSKLGISSADASYFLGLPGHYAGQLSRRKGFKFKPKSYLARIGVRSLTYRLASQIYEAKDAGFKRGEIAELLDTSRNVVAYAFDNGPTFAPKIVRVLRALYGSNVNKPYRVSA
ncbi:hypothetical protein HYS31_02325 [Candidatus Woesearchaeota archaeon]|nr:hypothetical protein [Candidatus Woesearchaeota archaeon]